MWDLEVDVACIGAGVGTLASAISTVDLGADVLLAIPSTERRAPASAVAVHRRVGGFLRSWSPTVTDAETDEYFAALSHGLESIGVGAGDSGLPVREVSAVTADDRTIAPFVGANLREWNAKCLASQYGLLYTSLSGWRTKSMRASDGQSLEVHAVASIDSAELADGCTISDWMLQKLRQRDVDMHEHSALERIVFEDGRVVGVVLATPDGPLRVGVRHGLSVSSRDPFVAPSDQLVAPSGPDGLQVCIVGQSASRFFRVELLDTVAAEFPVKPMCTASGRQLLAGLRVPPRALPSSVGRCREVR
ncbi:MULTISPECIES: hypothetical protein [unclassified Mycobacterium]|uniref:hypothetical protein n=1 Tax=unclassified Mycobacterium TaxID=2642494 RepID=UPI0029C95775|nr:MULTISPECIES: hypothetical protein [unclassified Mycobacterium]